MASLAICTEVSFAQAARYDDDFRKMSFEIDLHKRTLVSGEPLFVKFKLSNRTRSPLSILPPLFIHDSKLKVTINGKSSIFNDLSGTTGGPRLLQSVPPDWLTTEEVVLGSPYTSYFFPKPANYQIQFVLDSATGDKTLESNVIDITIIKPSGINKEAYDFMNKHGEFFGLSSWSPLTKEDLSLLETFVRKYGRSVYGELAIVSLGTYYYVALRKFDQAIEEFEKVRFSKNTLNATEAKRSLEAIDLKRKQIWLRNNRIKDHTWAKLYGCFRAKAALFRFICR